MANPVSSVDVPLSIFGSLNTELSPPDIPEGGSPANNDVVFTPGAVATRPGLNKLFAVPVSTLGPFSYQKSYVLPSGDVHNLYLSKGDGKLWVEDVSASPGTATLLFQSAGATYATSCTALGREYIMLSDGKHGVDIPLVYDGANLWRNTMEGPAAPPTVTSIAIPSTTMAAGAAPSITFSTLRTTDYTSFGVDQPFYASITAVLATGTVTVGQSVTVAGCSNAFFNGLVLSVDYLTSSGFVSLGWYNLTFESGTGGTASGGAGITAQRINNQVYVTTTSAHALQVGYQVQITGAGTSTIGGTISSIVINNEDNPGIATVTTSSAHGLLPNNQVNIQGVTGATVGTNITFVSRAGQISTITTASPHGLSIGSEVLVSPSVAGNVSFGGQFLVTSVPTSTTFTYVQVDTDFAATADAGSVKYIWPLANVNPAQNYFTVQTAPSSTSFTVSISYTDGTWTGGTVTFPWDGIFFVTAVPTSTTFQYQQYGPNTTTTATGKVTPYGQAAPGIHQVRVSWLTAAGEITAPSPPATFVANGGQYLQVSNIPSGPAEVTGRVLQFTGAGGDYFFYIPVQAQVNGLIVSTATQIDDNSTTDILMDFSDNTLYSATACSIPGNNLAAQVYLGPCAGVFSYASRMIAWADRNKVTNLLNMSFSGGGTPTIGLSAYDIPGWTSHVSVGINISLQTATALGISRPGDFVEAVGSIISDQYISQSMYRDTYNAPIALPSTKYSLRFYYDSSGTASAQTMFASITSASTAFSSRVNITIPVLSSGYIDVPLPTATPASIPSDLEFNFGFTTVSGVIAANELELYYTDQPYIANQAHISYAENPGAFDSQTGIIGPQDDTSAIMNFGTIRQSLYIVTGTGLHETNDNEQTEPSGWYIQQNSDNCGAFSIAAVGRNAQGIGSAGKDWMMWCGPDGAQIFLGSKPYKVSQEIQSIWDAIPAATAYQAWTKNYENAKWCFFGIPTVSGIQVMVLDYRNIDGELIPSNPPVHISFTGKMIVSDLTRKWTSWTISAYSGELLYRNTVAQPQISFGCSDPTGHANAYILNAAQYHDDDFGLIPASYTTYFFVSHEMEQALQVGAHRHLYKLSAAYISGMGTWSITPYAASLTNPFPTSGAYPLSSDPPFDMDFGINVESTRCAFKIQASPTSGTDSYFKLQKLVINMSPSPWAKVRGSGTGAF